MIESTEQISYAQLKRDCLSLDLYWHLVHGHIEIWDGENNVLEVWQYPVGQLNNNTLLNRVD